jgi:hypothetical protein
MKHWGNGAALAAYEFMIHKSLMAGNMADEGPVEPLGRSLHDSASNNRDSYLPDLLDDLHAIVVDRRLRLSSSQPQLLKDCLLYLRTRQNLAEC